MERDKLDNKLAGADEAAGEQRRGFVKKAAGAALLTTVASRSVWAGQCSLSGNLSGNLSGQDDQEFCELALYSPGGWRNGAASNLWSYTGYSPNNSVAWLLGGLNRNSNLDNGDSIHDALSGGNHGWERQAAAAALNACLWQYLLTTCQGNPNCSQLDYVSDRFYFPYTLQEVRNAYHSLDWSARNAWEAGQTL